MNDNKDFKIKQGYTTNLEFNTLQHYEKPPHGKRYQYDVYKSARKFIRTNPHLKTILDLGCGSGYKTKLFFSKLIENIYAVEQGFAVKEGMARYPEFTWISDDFEDEPEAIVPKADVIICADVIEHIKNPNNLLKRIYACSKPETQIYISTPERDLVRGKDHMGPPSNRLHVREWNKKEFSEYVEAKGFQILEHNIIEARKITIYEYFKKKLGFGPIDLTCQVVVCRIN